MQRVMRNFDTHYQISQYNGKWFWTFSNKGAGTHGPFNTEREAQLDAEEYIRIEKEYQSP
jgi:hypothetical protein